MATAKGRIGAIGVACGVSLAGLVAAGLGRQARAQERPQQERPLRHERELRQFAGVVNVEVPVRVFDGDRFVDNLTIGDFELLENGQPQKIVAIYRVQKTRIQNEESAVPAAGKPVPKTKRTIVMEFELLDPAPKIDDAMDYFFNEVLEPDDNLTIVTPQQTYRFKPEALARLPRPEIARQLKAKLRKDIIAGARDYKWLLRDIRDTLKMPLDPDLKMHLLGDYVRRLRDRLRINPAALQQLAQALKTVQGQKYVFLFYEREIVSDISSLFGNFGDESLPSEERSLADMAAADALRTPELTPAAIQQIFSDASITANFIYLTQSKMNAAGLDGELQRGGDASPPVKDVSSPIYGAFREMARATGGITDASGNPFSGFRKAVTASENYYLLYYVPPNYQPDGKFREIKVNVKGRSYRVTHRAGYFAN
jgi:VWFA-related protein